MAIEFRCSQCSQLLRVPDDRAGKNARCPKCGADGRASGRGPRSAAGDAGSCFAPNDRFAESGRATRPRCQCLRRRRSRRV